MRNLQSSYEEECEKIEEKSKLFLKRIMGEEKFDKLQKDGKIEIDVVNKLNGNTIYELYSNGHIVNKTKNQSYCIVADRSDYPIDDMVAIKYAHLVYNNELVEKVANRTNLYTGISDRFNNRPIPVSYGNFIRDMEQRGWNRQQVNITTTNREEIAIGGTPWYGDYVDYLSSNGWHRELLIIDENNTNLVTTRSVGKDTTGTLVDIRCPSGMKISIMGAQQVPRGADANIAYSLGLYIADDNGEEILDDNKIRITKEKTSEYVIQLARLFYSDIRMTKITKEKSRDTIYGDAIYRFKRGIEINGEDHIMIYIVNSQNNISSENVKFRIEADIWARDT